VREQAAAFGANIILIEDRASGTQLIQELVSEGMHSIQRYEPRTEKIMRMHSVCSTIENGFVHLPENAVWLPDLIHELATCPKGKFDDQVDSVSQALDWFKNYSQNQTLGLIEYLKKKANSPEPNTIPLNAPESPLCTRCGETMTQRIPGGLRCMQCGTQWLHPDCRPRIPHFNRHDILNGSIKFR
jgi:hypothetical protein